MRLLAKIRYLKKYEHNKYVKKDLAKGAYSGKYLMVINDFDTGYI